MKRIEAILCMLLSVATAMVGYSIHGKWFWAIADFFFWPLALAKWLICGEISLSIIQHTFSFLLK